MPLTKALFPSLLLVLTLGLPLITAPGTGAEAQSEDDFDRLLDLSLEELMGMEMVSAAKSSEKIEEIPASVVLITREEIEFYGYTTLTDLLEHIPGLYQIDDYNEGAKFGVRGFWSGVTNRNLVVLVNGVKQVEDRDQTNPLNKIAVPVESIDRIEVVRGPMSVIYGAGAMFGVINIITNQPDDSGSASVSYGSMSSKRVFARAARKRDDAHFVLNTSHFRTDGISEPYSALQSSPSPGAAGLSTKRRLEDAETYVNLSGRYRSVSLSASYTQSEKEFFFPLPAVADGSLRTTKAIDLAIGSRNEISPLLTLEGRFVFSSNSAALKYDVRRPDWIGNQKWESSAYELELDAFFRPNEQVSATFGLNSRSVFDLSDRFHIPSSGYPSTQNAERLLEEGEEIVTQAFFSQVNAGLSSKLSVVAGFRLERQLPYGLSDSKAGGLPEHTFVNGRFDRSQVAFIPRAAAIFKQSNSNVSKIMYGEAINRPSFLQNITNTLDPDRDSLEPEKVRTLELNQVSVLAGKYHLNLSIFRNSLTDLITRQALFVGGDYETFSDNGGKLVTHGLEASVRAGIANGLTLELSGTLQSTKDEHAEDRRVAYSPGLLAYLKAIYRFNERASLSLTSNYVDGMEPYYDVQLVDPNQGPGSPQKGRIGDRADGYLVLGASLRVEDLFLEGSYLSIRGTNLLDTTIRYPAFTINAWADRGALGVGRLISATFGYALW
jgi:outer membrane receptor for ferrienterochelin and colicins